MYRCVLHGEKMENQYYIKPLLAMIKGNFARNGIEADESNTEKYIALAKEKNLKLYHFKRTDRLLPRISKAIGILKGLYFESILDVGSGRGAFLLPFMDTFPYVRVTSLDILDKRYNMLKDMQNGGLEGFTALKEDICTSSLPDKSVDVVTMLEVLEHIPDFEKAISNAIRLARKYIVLSVPSKEDDNEEHIHLLTKEILTKCFNAHGVTKISFDSVPEHLIALVKI